MQPSNSQPTPPPQKEEKVGFWAKLFGKKPKTPTMPPRESHTPAPQLGNDEPAAPGAPPSVGTDSAGGDSGTSEPTSTTPDTTPTQVPPADTSVSSPVPGSDEQKPQQ